MSGPPSLAQALAKLDEAMRPTLGGSADPARRRCAQRISQLARCGDEELPAFAKRHLPGREIEGPELRAARDLLLAIDGIADLEDGGPDVWAALAEVKELLERRVAAAKEEAQRRKAEEAEKRKAEAEEAASLDEEETVTGAMQFVLPEAPASLPSFLQAQPPPARPVEAPRSWEAVEPPVAVPSPVAPPPRPANHLGSTADAPQGFPLPPLPFRGAASTSAEEPLHVETDVTSDEPPEMTVAVRLPVGGRAALPFGAAVAPSPPASTPRVQETPKVEVKLPVSSPPDEEDHLESTGQVRALSGPILPFRPSLLGLEAASPPSSPSPPVASSPAESPPVVLPPVALPPVALPPVALPPVAPPPAPSPPVDSAPRAPAAEQPKLLPIAQYASLCAELSVFPEASERIFHRYGLDTDDKRAAVDAAWKERLRLDPAEYNRWQELYQRYRSLWMQHG